MTFLQYYAACKSEAETLKIGMPELTAAKMAFHLGQIDATLARLLEIVEEVRTLERAEP